jgi:hypothetical protein
MNHAIALDGPRCANSMGTRGQVADSTAYEQPPCDRYVPNSLRRLLIRMFHQQRV